MTGLSLFSGIGGLDLTVNGNYNRKGLSKTSGDGLATFVWKLLPTPTANDAKNNGTTSQQNRNSAALNAVARGSLNPDWVEVLMGFPRGWTEIGRTESPEYPEESRTGCQVESPRQRGSAPAGIPDLPGDCGNREGGERMSHTPGPWKVDKEGFIWGRCSGGSRMEISDFHIAELRGYGHLQYREDGEQMQAANARLIAAAPEMYEALENLLEACQLHVGIHRTPIFQAMHQATTALAKARSNEGEEDA